MTIDAKINLQINGISSFWNKRYKVYLNDNFVGNLDYKKHKIGIWSKVGTQKLVVKRKDFEKELEVNLTADKHIITVNIDENASFSSVKSKVKYSKLLKGVSIGFSVIYVLALLLFTVYADYAVNSAFYFLFFAIFYIAFPRSKDKLPFDLRIKNA